MNLKFRNLKSKEEVLTARSIEITGFSEEEAASLENMLYRFTNAPHLFLGAFGENDELLGYIMSTQGASALVTHESMSKHDPNGPTVCIHSVCVAPKWRRRGIALRLLNAYTESVREYNKKQGLNKINRLAMMSRQNLIPLYERAGYKCLGPSSVVHGDEAWYDCVLDL
ncbi:hypothetical protein GGI07_001186 [Coemansia sp. Benny D115]|nr:hypothetical protein GGI07_001186 [Coemansia sp. Benny D115]